MELAFDLQGLQSALKVSFVNWSVTHPVYASLWQRMEEPVRKITLDAIDELQVHKPGFFEVWWATHHNRYIRLPGVTQKQLVLMFEVFYAYLCVLARGELGTLESIAESTEQQAEAPAPKRKAKFGRR